MNSYDLVGIRSRTPQTSHSLWGKNSFLRKKMQQEIESIFKLYIQSLLNLLYSYIKYYKCAGWLPASATLPTKKNNLPHRMSNTNNHVCSVLASLWTDSWHHQMRFVFWWQNNFFEGKEIKEIFLKILKQKNLPAPVAFHLNANLSTVIFILGFLP